MSSYHSLERTSPKGEKFVGYCTKCGKQGLTFADQDCEECPNPVGTTQDEDVINAIERK